MNNTSLDILSQSVSKISIDMELNFQSAEMYVRFDCTVNDNFLEEFDHKVDSVFGADLTKTTRDFNRYVSDNYNEILKQLQGIIKPMRF